MNVINIVSTLLAMYGFILIANMTDVPLKPYCTKPLMKLTQLTIVLYNIQGGIFNLLAQQGVIKCSELLPALSRAARKSRISHVGIRGSLLGIRCAVGSHEVPILGIRNAASVWE